MIQKPLKKVSQRLKKVFQHHTYCSKKNTNMVLSNFRPTILKQTKKVASRWRAFKKGRTSPTSRCWFSLCWRSPRFCLRWIRQRPQRQSWTRLYFCQDWSQSQFQMGSSTRCWSSIWQMKSKLKNLNDAKRYIYRI